jgi:DNA-binding CsgD family transcriptional regulator
VVSARNEQEIQSHFMDGVGDYFGVERFNSPDSYCLTNRELQIAELVAFGLTNAEIGAKIWITEHSVKQALKRIFRKLSVVNRTQMVAKLHNIGS